MNAPFRWLALIPWLAAAALAPSLRPHDYVGGRSRDTRAQADVQRGALAIMLGGFRTSLSDLLYIQAERCLHNGVAYVPHSDEPESGVEDEHEHGERAATVIPGAAQDYRGWIGRMHRQVQPWQDSSESHDLAAGTELIPWFRMMTLSDPHHVRGYNIGSYWIRQRDPVAAMEYLDEGLRNNPESFELHLTKGMMLLGDARTGFKTPLENPAPEQLALLRRARESFQTAAELMLRVRPAAAVGDVAQAPGWSVYQETDAMAAANMAVVFENRYGDPVRARELARRYLAAMPDHAGLRRFLDETATP